MRASSNRKSELAPISKLNKQIIQEAFLNGKKNNISFEVLATIFDTLRLNNQEKKNPGTHAVQIQTNINKKMIPNQITPPRKGPFLDPKAEYPLNKAGAFGALVRTCTIVEKGIEEREGNGAPKFKEIVDFVNRIETEKTKNNEKLDWIKENTQYPFRIILKDKEKKAKAIYFKTKQEAEKVRISYILKLVYKSNVKKIMIDCQQKYKERTIENTKSNLILFRNDKKLKQAEQAKSRKSRPLEKSVNEGIPENKQKKDKDKEKKQSEDLLNRKSELNSQKGYSSDMIKSLVNKDEDRLSQASKAKSRNLVFKLEEAYMKNMFQNWRKKAYEFDENRKVEQERERNKKINSMEAKSRMNPSSKAVSEGISALTFQSIELLKQSNILIKPQVTISLFKGPSTQAITSSKFNSIIEKKDPYLSYELVLEKGTEVFQIKGKITQYEIGIVIIDYLSNSKICDERIVLKSKIFSDQTYLIDEEKVVRLRVGYQSEGKIKVLQQDNPEGAFLEIKGLSEKAIDEIRSYWQKQSVKRGYYNISKDINIIEIFSLCEQPPKYWALGLSDQTYKIISLLTSASKMLSFNLTQSILPVLKILQPLYSQVSELVEVTLSIIINYMRPYYCQSEFNRINRLHSMVGLQGQIQLQSKISLEMEILKKIIKIQCDEFVDKMSRRGIGYVQLLYQYVYELYSKNFKLKVLIEIWNFIFKDPSLIPIYMLLIGAWLVKFYAQKLKKCHRFQQICLVLESHETCSSDVIIRQLIILRQKYFPISNSATIMESIKEIIFNAKPLQQVVIEFYRRETERLDRKKQNRYIEKNLILQKLSNEIPIQLPRYPHKTYCLHIYFYKLPSVPGSLYIRANGIQYECINISKTRYFIIGDVSTEIVLEFINNKSDEYTCQLQCMQGINRYTVELQSKKDSQAYKVEYICGLLTEGHIESLKKNRKFQHFIGSYVKQEELFDEFLRPIGQCSFLNGIGKRLEKEDLGKKIKVIFSSGSKNFDEIEFYLRWIYISPITLPEKFKLIKELAMNISRQYFLSNSPSLQKILLSLFFSMMEFPISPLEFQSYYSDSLTFEFKAPKILKCRLNLPNGTSHKLQHLATQYLSNKARTHLHEDILINDLIVLIQKQLESALVNVVEAVLVIIYSSEGQVNYLQIPIVKKRTGKQFAIDESKFEIAIEESNDINTTEPQVLVTQIMPTFSKISTILDFVNNSKSVQSLGRNKETRNLPQTINLLKNCDLRFKKILVMRYQEHPSRFNVPFFNYYHELICEAATPILPKNMFLNNLQTDIKAVCTFEGILNFTDNKKLEPTLLDKNFGLYGNLRILPPKTDNLYFTSVLPEQQILPNAKLFVNYGYGTFRWEPCTVLSYFYSVKEKQNNINKQKKPKKNFIVKYGRAEKIYRDFQLRMNPNVQENLPNFENKTLSSPMKASSIRKGEMMSSKRQLGSITSKKNLDESGSRRTN